MDESFHFRLLRVSISQIIKASGYDKCKPSVMNALTDLYIHSFQRLIKTARKCSETRTRSSSMLQVQDVMQALIFTGEIKPENYFKLDDDPMYENTRLYPVSAYNTRSLDSFIDWMGYSDIYRVSQQLNEPPQSLIKNLIEKRKLDLDDSSTDHERRKRKYQEKQNYYNSMLHRTGTTDGSNTGQDEQEHDDVDEITHRDKLRWLNYLIEKDMKLGQDLKFTNTSLINEFLKFQENRKFHPHAIHDETGMETRDENQDFRHRIQHLNDHDYMILPVEEVPAPEESADTVLTAKPVADKGTSSALTPHPSAQLMEYLPYNIQYPESLTRDDLEQFILYRDKLESERGVGKMHVSEEETEAEKQAVYEEEAVDPKVSNDESDKLTVAKGEAGEGNASHHGAVQRAKPETEAAKEFVRGVEASKEPVPEREVEYQTESERGVKEAPESKEANAKSVSEEDGTQQTDSVSNIETEEADIEGRSKESQGAEKLDSPDVSAEESIHSHPSDTSVPGSNGESLSDAEKPKSQGQEDPKLPIGKEVADRDNDEAIIEEAKKAENALVSEDEEHASSEAGLGSDNVAEKAGDETHDAAKDGPVENEKQAA